MDKTAKRRGLGRGLGALIAGADHSEDIHPTAPLEAQLTSITPNPWQPRRRFTEASIDELADSIRERGIVQPLVVRRKGDAYELIAGERRLRAAERAGLQSVPISVRETTDAEMLEIALVENVQREDLNPIEEALAYRRLADELGLRHEEIAGRVGKDRSTVSNSLRLLALPSEVQEAVEVGRLSAGHARAIAMAGSPEAMLELARRALASKLSVRQTERMAKTNRPRDDKRSPELRDVEERLTRALGTKVRITPKSNVAGTLAIEYFSLDQFDQLLRRFGA